MSDETRIRALQARHQELLPNVLRARALAAEPERAEKAMKRITEITRNVLMKPDSTGSEIAVGRIAEIVFQFNQPLLVLGEYAEVTAKLDQLSAAAAPPVG